MSEDGSAPQRFDVIVIGAGQAGLAIGHFLAGQGKRFVIVDAANRTITLTPNAAGNFYYTGAVTFPFHAKITYQGRERIMTAAQSNGNCNSCHTQNGANGAPGRILLP